MPIMPLSDCEFQPFPALKCLNSYGVIVSIVLKWAVCGSNSSRGRRSSRVGIGHLAESDVITDPAAESAADLIEIPFLEHQNARSCGLR